MPNNKVNLFSAVMTEMGIGCASTAKPQQQQPPLIRALHSATKSTA
jgi:hypothetical protein